MPRNLPARDEQRLQAAVARGALTPARAEHWRVYAAAGHDISFIDQLAGVLPTADSPAASGRPGAVAAAGPRPDSQKPNDEAEYRLLFGSAEQGQRIADARALAARDAIAALTDDGVYERMFPSATRRAAPEPVAASAAGGAGQPAPGEAGRPRYRVRTTRVSLRVPGGPDGVAAGADPAKISWRTIELRAGDVVPEDAHADDVARLLHSKTRLGPMLKPW